MKGLLLRSSLRHLLGHWLQTSLAVLGVALGVALVVGVDSANSAARRAFSLSVEGVSGKATHQLVPAGEGGLPDSLMAWLRHVHPLVQAAPVVSDYVSPKADSSRTLQLIGIDPFAEAPFRPYLGGQDARTQFPLGPFLTQPGATLVPRQVAEDLHLTVGDSFTIRHQGQLRRLHVLALLEPSDDNAAQAMAGLLVTDISTAQEVLGHVGRLSHVDVILADALAEATLRSTLPAGVLLERATARTQRLDEMTAAFRLNLTALGLLALVVGILLVYNTVSFSVVQRTTYLGLLRAVGVTPAGIGRVVLREAALLGLLGSVVGLLLGWALAGALTRLVSQSINDLYFVVEVRQALPDVWVFGKGLLVGIGATLIGAVGPARSASRIAPRATLQRSHSEQVLQRRLPRLLLLAGALAALSAVLLFTGQDLALAYLGLLAGLAAFAVLVPWFTIWLLRLLTPMLGRIFGLLGRMAARDVSASLSRTSVAVAALSIAVAATIGVGVMVSSFRTTVVVWLRGALQSDVYVSPPSPVARRNDATLAPGVVQAIQQAPAVASVATIRSIVTTVQGRTVQLVALGGVDAGEANAEQRFLLTEGDEAAALTAMQQGQILISEPLAFRLQRKTNDSLTLQTDNGPINFSVAGIFYDYGSDLGIIYIGRNTYHRHYRDRGTSGLGIMAKPGIPADSLVRQLQQVTAPYGQQLNIRSNQALLNTSLAIFDRTFAITGALRLLTVLVAFVGVFSALMALLLARARELAVLRALGLTPRQLGSLSLLQTGLMGLIAGALAIPVGVGLAAGLVYVVNRRSFGWTLQFEVAPELLVQGLVLAVLAALLAGLYPAWKMARAQPAAALREE